MNEINRSARASNLFVRVKLTFVSVFYSSSVRIAFGGKVAAGGKLFRTQFNFHLSWRVCFTTASSSSSQRNLDCTRIVTTLDRGNRYLW